MIRTPRIHRRERTEGETPRSVRAALRNLPRAFSLVWACSRSGTLFMATLTLLGGLLPAAQAYTAKLIVDSVVGGLQAGLPAADGVRSAIPYLLMEFGLLLGNTAITQGRSLTEHVLHSRLNHQINSEIIRKALELDLRYFEDAKFYDKLQNARREADWRALRIVNGGFLLAQNVITLTSLGALVLRFSPLLLVVIMAAAVPSFMAQSKYARLSFRVLSWRAPEARRLAYLEELLTTAHSAKEVKLFNLGIPLLGRYQKLYHKFHEEDTQIAIRRSMASVGWGLLSTVTYYVSYAWIIWRALAREITLGDMTMYIAVFRQTQGTFRALFDGTAELYENSLFLDNLFGFLELEPAMPVAQNARPAPTKITTGIEFRNVSFRYPGVDHYVLRDVNLLINPTERIALVGLNGAGKTTLIKLLTRLYDPTEGQILLDGIDLRDYDLASLRRCVGVIFQDFVRYHLAARENIGFGRIEEAENMERVAAAAQRGGATSIVDRLPQGYETLLGRQWERGHELSGGEWQKIALSRAFMRDAQVLVLDEPTASLDAAAEYEVFRRFGELTEGKMALLVSHRFSTVRMADRIIVIEDGRITENGPHHELLAAGGTYARLFNVQAEGYR